MKKIVVISVIVLFVGMSFTSISGNQINNKVIKSSNKGNILYVGGSGEGNYSKIQDAIDNASDGDTVFVYDDSSPYNDEVKVDKSINLIGEDRDTTVIDDWITFEVGGVNISGFTIKNDGIDAFFSNYIISDNHFISCFSGIYLIGEDSVIISNTFKNCLFSIYNEGSNNVRITNNVFINLPEYYTEGVIFCVGGSNHVIRNNTFINYEKEEYGAGVHFELTDSSIIEDNEFNGYSDCAIWTYWSRNNLISHNTFINNDLGICIGFFSGSNRIINNNFVNNNKDAMSMILAKNIFDGNYWDDWIGLKYPILSFLPYFHFEPLGSFIDWHPAKEPYNMTTTQEYDLV